MPIQLDAAAQARARAALQSFFEAERGEKLGNLAADLLIECLVAEIGPDLFNLGIRAAKKRLTEVWDGVDKALEFLELRPEPRGKRAR
jgi:uncharacterized protein (DUF2164 family)